MARVIRKIQSKTPDEKKETLIRELIEIYGKIGFKVRTEKGNFKGGFCLLREQKILLLNKNLSQEKKIGFLLKNLSELNTEEIYIKPAIRELIDNQSFV
ncbi:MAG: hypothetical protein JW917_10900 [Ignavibacteria bacterium]|nr:hypothetical protein [Ignavibacteria bacterium]